MVEQVEENEQVLSLLTRGKAKGEQNQFKLKPAKSNVFISMYSHALRTASHYKVVELKSLFCNRLAFFPNELHPFFFPGGKKVKFGKNES